MEITPTLQGLGGTRASEIKVLEVDAFSSVHDMIHAAINSNGANATLRQVYQACEEKGRIAYKRSGGSRLITHNDHWKSQIRHALYTCDRFMRATEGADMWTISPAFQHIRPQTTKVLIRTDSNAGSVSNESVLEGNRRQHPTPQQRRGARRTQRESDPPFLAALQRRKRSSRQQSGGSPPKPLGDSRAASPFPPRSEQVDESSHIDFIPANGIPRYQVRGATPPSSSQMDYTIVPSPFARTSGEQSAWHRAARQLNSALNGSDDDAPSLKRARSAEAESPSTSPQLYALRSRSKPPPGFGENPDPAAEKAAREAHAMTVGPLKKRLKAAAKAAELAITTASTAHEEAMSTRTGLGCLQARGPTVPAADTSCTNGKPPVGWPPCKPSPEAFTTPPPNLRTRGRDKGLTDQLTAYPANAAHLASLSSCGEGDEAYFTQLPTLLEASSLQQQLPKGSYRLGRAASAFAKVVAGSVGGSDVQEGADETDEGGSKRLLRSQAAAAAADLERDGDLDRTGWH